MARSPFPLNLPCPLAPTTVPVTGVPARKTVTPWTTTDWASAPLNESPTLFVLALTACSMRTARGVPLGTVYTLGAGGGGGAAGGAVMAFIGGGGAAGAGAGAGVGAG